MPWLPSFASVKKNCKKICSAIGDGTTAFLSAVPGIAKVTAIVGTTVFNVSNFCRYIGASEVVEIGITIPLAFSTLITNVINRYFFMYRGIRTTGKKDPTDPTCCSPGVNAKGQPYNFYSSYILLQIIMSAYSNFGALSAYLGIYAFNNFSQITFNTSLNTQCDSIEEQSASWKMYLFLASIALLGIFNKLSFNLFNWQAIVDYYKEFILEKGWKQFHPLTWIESTFGTIISTILIFFSSDRLLDMFQENTLCHWTKQKISESWSYAFSSISSIVNLITTGFMTFAAVHKRRSKKEEENREDYLKFLPIFRRFDKFFQTCFSGDGVANGLGMFFAATNIAKSMKLRDDLNYHPGMIFFGIVSGIFIMRNQIAVNFEGYMRELKTRIKLLEILIEPLMKEEKKAHLSPADEKTKETVVDISPISESSPKKINEKLMSNPVKTKTLADPKNKTATQFAKNPQKSSRVFQSREYHVVQADHESRTAPKRSRRR